MNKSILIAIICCLFVGGIMAQGQFKALLFTKTDGWHHESINEGVDAIRALGERHHFTVEWHEDAGRINEKNLEQYAVIIFLNTTADILNEEQQAAMEKFIQGGKGFVGIHAASDTEYDWPWYRQLVGRMFVIHPVIQTARISKIDDKFPGLEVMPEERIWTDEWYEYGPEEVEGLNYLITVDETTFDAKADWGRVKGEGMGEFHPLAWYHEYDGGRSFYTGLGHMPSCYSDHIFLEHLYGGIYWAATGKGIKE